MAGLIQVLEICIMFVLSKTFQICLNEFISFFFFFSLFVFLVASECLHVLLPVSELSILYIYALEMAQAANKSEIILFFVFLEYFLIQTLDLQKKYT